MSTETRAEAPRHEHRLSTKKFLLHYVEMVIAMAVGMIALHPLWSFLLDVFAASWLMHDPYTGALIMATNMTIAMSAWMAFRGHGLRPIVEMGAAMYLPFVVLFVPLGLGLITPAAMMLWGHVGMLFAMALAMLARPAEYAHC